MGIKLELLLVGFAAAILYMAMTVEIKNTRASNAGNSKEMEFYNTVIREVDTHGGISISHGEYGVRVAGVLTINNLRYHTNNLKLLKAKKGTYKGELILLDYNVSVNKEDGTDYYTEHAVYNKTTAMLVVTSPFLAIVGKNQLRGSYMVYNTVKKNFFAKDADALIFTEEK